MHTNISSMQSMEKSCVGCVVALPGGQVYNCLPRLGTKRSSMNFIVYSY